MSHSDLELTALQQWVNKTEQRDDPLHPACAHALAALIDGPLQPGTGQPLPPLWHWIYFWNVCKQSEIGADGHPQRGGFLPPVSLPRRMWAGGRLRFEAPLLIGGGATKRSRIDRVDVKHGRTGALVFVTVKHEITQAGRICIHEEHDIVYREMPQPGVALPKITAAPTDAQWTRRIDPDPVLLFRYSALTFNGHRIHYDRPYVTEVEGYPGLVVHGPLIASLLAELVAREMPHATLRAFDFRAVGSLFDTEGFELCGKLADDEKSVELWAQNLRGELAMQAYARIT